MLGFRIYCCKNLRGGASSILGVIVVVLIIAAGVGFLYLSNDKSSLEEKLGKINPFKTSYQKLGQAMSKVLAFDSIYIDYKMKDKGRITVTKTGLTQTVEASVDGYISGSTDGKTQKMEMRISSPVNPAASIVVSVINTDDGSWYVKGPATSGKWQKYSKEEYEKMSNENDLDASLYGLNILGTLFSESKALFKTIQKDSVEVLPTETLNGKTFDKYAVEISIPDFLAALDKDIDINDKERRDSKIILKDAIIKATFLVDKASNYVTKIITESKNLTFVPNPEIEKAGISTTYDIETTADLSRFGLPTNISAPDTKDVIPVKK